MNVSDSNQISRGPYRSATGWPEDTHIVKPEVSVPEWNPHQKLNLVFKIETTRVGWSFRATGTEQGQGRKVDTLSNALEREIGRWNECMTTIWVSHNWISFLLLLHSFNSLTPPNQIDSLPHCLPLATPSHPSSRGATLLCSRSTVTFDDPTRFHSQIIFYQWQNEHFHLPRNGLQLIGSTWGGRK